VANYFSAGPLLVLDETMIKFRGRLKFRQFMKDKPVKWGVKCFLICNATSGYCHKMEVSLEKMMQLKH